MPLLPLALLFLLPLSILFAPAPVPGPIEAPAEGRTVWLRAWVKVDPSFFSKHERNLFEESVGVHFRDFAGAHELHVNGIKVGTGGSFEPYRSGAGEIFRHKVPVGTLRKDEWNELAFRIFAKGGKGGFTGEAPFIMNYFQESVLEGEWELIEGDGFRPGPALKDRPASFTFDKFRESNRVLGRATQVHGPKLSPAEAYAKIRTLPGLEAELLLSEPQVAQPTHFSFDSKGRLWVTQYRQYPYPAGVNMVSRDKYYRSHYDRVPPPPPFHDKGADVVSIHEDTDGDGKYDRHKVFQDGLNMANSSFRAHGGVWVMSPPYLLFYPDANGDDVPDGAPVVHLQGFGLEDTHSVGNGIILGPDGWIYGVHGSTSSSRVTRPGFDSSEAGSVHFEGCMVWRYHPKTREYDIFCEGSGNPFGLDVDADGRLYSGHNGGNTRGWHYVQGGIYLKQGVDPGKFGPPRGPYSFGQLPILGTRTKVPRFAHYGTFVEGTAMPRSLAGHLLSIDPLHNTVTDSERIWVGATYETSDLGIPMWSEDVGFRPLYIANAPDGSVYVSDMYEFYIAHGQHYQNQIDPTTGRMYRLKGQGATLDRDLNLEGKSSAQLVALLAHPNKWHRTMSLQLLAERRDLSVVDGLEGLLFGRGTRPVDDRSDAPRGALGALWALYQMGELTDARAIRALSHGYAPVRHWATRFLGDKYGVNRGLGVPGIGSQGARDLPADVFQSLLDRADVEPDAEVRSQMASTARRLTTPQALRLLDRLVRRDEDVTDRYIPLLHWWTLEAHVSLDREAVIGFLRDGSLWDRPVMQEHLLPRLMRRFATEGRRADLLVCARLLGLAPSAAHTTHLMKGFEEAYRGREMSGLPDELLKALAASGRAPLVLRVRQGEAAAIAEALGILRNPKSKPEDRILQARLFGEVRHPEAPALLLSVATADPSVPLRKAALISLMAYDDPAVGPQAVGMLSAPKLDGEVRTAVLALLASRSAWSADLLRAVKSGSVAASVVPADIVDRMRGHPADDVKSLLGELYPLPVSNAGADWNARIVDVERRLKAGTGNPYAGEATFMERCASCHRLFFKGGRIGPDLTAYQRDNLGTMLISLVNPNAEIREGFQYFSVQTVDGRSLSGFLVERDTQILVLRGLEGEDITLRQADVKTLVPVGRSLMPEGLLDGLSDQQLRDLFAYLRISQPITK